MQPSTDGESSMKKSTSIELRNRVYDIIKEKSFRRGSVTLSSGKKSDFYFDMKPTMLDPEGATKLAELVLFRLKDTPVEHGTQRKIEGEDISGKNVVILDDVTTTGESAMMAARAAQEAGAKVLMVMAIVDREEGAEQTFAKAGIPFLKLFAASEFLSA